MGLLNWFLLLALTGMTFYQAVYALRRRGAVEIRGGDDVLYPMLFLCLVMVLLPVKLSTTLLDMLRSVVAILSVFGSFLIRRGVSQAGLEKYLFVVPWSRIRQVRADIPSGMRVPVYFETDAGRYKLIFHARDLRRLLDFCAEREADVLLSPQAARLVDGVASLKGR